MTIGTETIAIEELTRRYDRAVDRATDCESRMWDYHTKLETLKKEYKVLFDKMVTAEFKLITDDVDKVRKVYQMRANQDEYTIDLLVHRVAELETELKKLKP
jgi:hypothetical protein